MREQRGLAQKYVALSIGVDPSYISRLEAGDLIPSQVLLVTLAAFYEVPLSVFGVVAGAVIDAKLTPAQEIAEYLLTELQKLVIELDVASEEIRGNKKLKALIDSARRRADTFLIVVKRARGHALRRKSAPRDGAEGEEARVARGRVRDLGARAREVPGVVPGHHRRIA
jgi:transcriptional regulator with XRE-family HTH domain